MTPEEAATYRKVREQIQAEKADLVKRYQVESPGPGCWSDIHELRSLVQLLRGERERRGFSRAEVAKRAGLEAQQIEDLEEHRELNPAVSILSRFAAAVGRHLMLGISAGEPIAVSIAGAIDRTLIPSDAAHS